VARQILSSSNKLDDVVPAISISADARDATGSWMLRSETSYGRLKGWHLYPLAEGEPCALRATSGPRSSSSENLAT